MALNVTEVSELQPKTCNLAKAAARLSKDTEKPRSTANEPRSSGKTPDVATARGTRLSDTGRRSCCDRSLRPGHSATDQVDAHRQQV